MYVVINLQWGGQADKTEANKVMRRYATALIR